MNLKTRLILFAVRFGLRRPSPSRIPRSGEAGRAVDCFTIELSGEGGEVLVSGVEKHFLRGLLWDGQMYCLQCRVSFSLLRNASFKIIHYVGLASITYHSPFKFLLWELLRIPYILVRFEAAKQKVFNLKTFHRSKRMDALEVLMKQRIRSLRLDNIPGRDTGISVIEFMQRVYGARIFHHKQFDDLYALNASALESLVASGDAELVEGTYRATTQSLVTLSSYEEDNRRHRDRALQNWLIVILTFVIAIAAVVQAFSG